MLRLELRSDSVETRVSKQTHVSLGPAGEGSGTTLHPNIRAYGGMLNSSTAINRYALVYLEKGGHSPSPEAFGMTRA
jgi:hypothetical protein